MITKKAKELRKQYEELEEKFAKSILGFKNYHAKVKEISIELNKEIAHNCKPTAEEFHNLLNNTVFEAEGLYYLLYERRKK